MRDLARIQVVGPLAAFESGFRERLDELGYAHESRATHLMLMREFSRWLGELDSTRLRLDECILDAFMRARRDAGATSATSVRSLAPLVDYLHEIGAAPPQEPVTPTAPVEVLLEEYRAYLAGERGLAEATIKRELRLVAPFLRGHVRDGTLSAITAVDVTGFMLECAGSASAARVQMTGTALRSLLRFLHVTGHLDVEDGITSPAGACDSKLD